MIKFVLSSALIMSTTFTYAQNNDPIIQTLNNVDAAGLSRFYDGVIDVKLPEKEEVKNVGKKQAGVLVKSFFDEKGIKSFSLLNQRSLGGTSYVAGKLEGSDGKSYNITIMIRAQASGEGSIMFVRIN